MPRQFQFSLWALFIATTAVGAVVAPWDQPLLLLTRGVQLSAALYAINEITAGR